MTDLAAVRSSGATGAWSRDAIAWDYRGQLVWVYNDTPQSITGHWTQKVYLEKTILRRRSL